MTVGYSGTPLVKKLGIKASTRIAILHMPDGYPQTLGSLPSAVTVHTTLEFPPYDFVHAFYEERVNLESEFNSLKLAIQKNGMIWISWYKKAAKIPTDLTENRVRDIGLAHGLVDVKVCAVDERWSGLKFVYRKHDR